MNNHHIANLLWADDDSTLMLKPLQWGLERGGFRIWPATSYAEAMELLDTAPEPFESLLVDTILPRAEPGTLHPFTGLTLATHAAHKGVRSVVFLSVVAQSEVGEQYEEIVRAYPTVHFHYVNKLFLLEPYAIENLIASLKSHTSS
jgi:hypothetical protein